MTVCTNMQLSTVGCINVDVADANINATHMSEAGSSTAHLSDTQQQCCEAQPAVWAVQVGDGRVLRT